MEEIIRTIDGEYDDWVSLQRLDAQTTTIADTVQTISCDTRDFALGWNFNQPERYEDDSCGLEHRSNEGLAHMAELMAKGDMQPYVIEQQEILTWLGQLCQKSGGFDHDWRYLDAKVDGCRNWDIKYIRFVRYGDSHFIVCNAYWWPIEWRKVLDNLYDPMEEERKMERLAEQAAPMLLTNPYAHLYDAPKPKPVYYDGPCCQRCKNRFRSSQFCADHHQEQRCYRFKLDK